MKSHDELNNCIPYFYIIQHITTGKYYAGSQYGKDANPNNLLISYTTSSSLINEIIKHDGINSFVIKKIRVFAVGNDAYAYETKFLQKLDCANHPLFYNKHNNNGGMNIHYTNIGYSWFNNGTNAGMFADGTEPIGWIKGRLTLKSKGKVYYNDGETSKMFFVEDVPDGWVKGNLSVSGENNAAFGKPSLNSSMCLYHFNNTTKFFKEGEQPINWTKGSTDTFKQKRKQATIGNKNPRYGSRNEKFYNNGVETILCVPGSEPTGFILGIIKRGVKFYNNGKICKKFIPGTEPDGFVLGRII